MFLEQLTNNHTLATLLAKGSLVITANNRLSQQLTEDYVLYYQQPVLEKPTILAYSSCLVRWYQALIKSHPSLNFPLLLSSAQQTHLWQLILGGNDSEQRYLLQQVQSAWHDSLRWRIPLNDASFGLNDTTAQFQQWQRQFEQQLQQLDAITCEHIASYLLQQNDWSMLPKQGIVWACFNEYTPEQQALQKAIAQQGCPQYHYDLPPNHTVMEYIAASDEDNEYLQLIQWLKERLAAEDKRIAIVVPELEAKGTIIKRHLYRHLPNHFINLSLGKPLYHYPLVAHALMFLSINEQNLTNEQARLLLFSPYLGAAQKECESRAQSLQSCRLLQEKRLTLRQLTQQLHTQAPDWATRLQTLTTYISEKAPISEWIQQFKQRLQGLGFPGELALDSENYQCFQRFLEVINALQSLAFIQPLMTASEALQALNQLTKHTIFQSQSPVTPIHILGLLEASGCTFDSVWVCGLTNHCLPQRASPSPFIPLIIQKNYNMPKASPTHELYFAKELLARLQRGCQQMIVSYPQLIADIPQSPSPFIAHLPLSQPYSLPPKKVSALLAKDESYHIELKPSESPSGGTSLLANQAKCPFKAFATHRLYAQPALNVSSGPSPSERGQIIHKVLELFWQTIGSKQQLLALSSQQLSHHVENAINQTLPAFTQWRYYSFSPLIQNVERERLRQLVYACLAWEKTRPDFTVMGTEQTFVISIAGFDFRVRVDRLDKVGDTKWVIDYKSRLPYSLPWYEERPEEPQLLLYALLDKQIDTLLFVELKKGQLTYSGISGNKHQLVDKPLPLAKENWDECRNRWQTQLAFLADEFYSGYCPPTPNRASQCQQCHYVNLCRKAPD